MSSANTEKTPIPLVEFAFKRQAVTDAIVNAIINMTVTWFVVGAHASLPVISAPGSEFALSLLGSLVPPAVVIAFLISIITTKMTINKRVKGHVLPPLEAGTPWLRKALMWGAIRACINVLAVYGVGGIIVQFVPDLQVTRLPATLIVGIIAGLLAYINSVNAVLRTQKSRYG